jgi:ankyrin repeat protein
MIDKFIIKNNKINDEIFVKMENKKWNDIIEIIKNDKNNIIDYNVKNNSNVCLLEYLILNQKNDIIEILLNKNVNIDYLDDNNKSILYNIIKFNFVETYKLILNKNNNIIGKNIFEIYDNDNNIPLFYAIKFKNENFVELILKEMTNINNKNNNGETPLLYTITNGTLNILKLLLDKSTYLKQTNNNEETILHLIIKNNKYDMLEYLLKNYKNNLNYSALEIKFEFSVFHYLSIKMDYKMFVIMNDNEIKFDNNIQDKLGNTPYYYFIKNLHKLNNVDEINKINNMLTINYNYNLFNIDNETTCHIIIKNYKNIKDNLIYIFEQILKNSNLNIQNMCGFSPFALLIKYHLWKKYRDILITKKLDIFIFLDEKKTLFDLINENDYDEFIELITQSYLHQLTTNNKWIDKEDKYCMNMKKPTNKTDLIFLKKMNIDIKNNKEIICYELINNKIKKMIDIFLNEKTYNNIYSYPIKEKYKLNFDYIEYDDKLLNYNGTSLEIICGLIYLDKKYNNMSNYVRTPLNFIDLDNIVSCQMTNDKNICNIVGYEITWKFNKLDISFFDILNEKILEYINEGIYFIVIPIGIEVIINNEIYGHSNSLIFDLKKKLIIRFEPHGKISTLDYNDEMLDSLLINKFNNLSVKFKYLKPNEYQFKIGFQIKEINEKNQLITDPDGYCSLWCILFNELVLNNNDIPLKKLINLLSKKIINNNISYKNIIRNYSYNIIIILNKILINANINYNDWLYDNLTDKQINNLKDAIKNEIIR